MQKGVQKVIDSAPFLSYENEVCVVYTTSAPLHPLKIANALNMAHELAQLPSKATKSQMQAIINKYKQS